MALDRIVRVPTSMVTLLLGVHVLTTVATAAGTLTAGTRRPNVLFIAIDDLNDWAAGLSAYKGARTPHIDRLARRGVLFTNAHCAAPACNPSRTSVMTGVSPSTSGVYLNQQDWRECERLRNVVTLPQHFLNNGYRVLGGGKLYHAASLSEQGHTGYLDPRPWHEFFPSKTRQLPDEVKPTTFPANGSERFYRGYFDWAPLDVPDAEMADAKVVAWAERQLAARHEEPLFLAVGVYRPHIPWYTPRTWFDRHPLDAIELPTTRPDDLDDVPAAGRAMARRPWHEWLVENDKWPAAVQGYLASVAFADAMVGRLVKALDDGPLSENTIVVLWSDHGYHLGHKEHWEKFALWEQATHVPLIVVAPGSENAGARCAEPVSLLDLYPTLVELCRLGPPEGLEGRSLVRLLEDPEATTDRAVVTTHGFGNHAVRSRHWRYIRYLDGSEELYDHRRDPEEFDNLAGDATHEAIKRRLVTSLPTTNSPPDPPERRPTDEP